MSASAAAAPQRTSSSIERAALAAIAAAVAPEAPQHPVTYGDVTVRPIAQKPTLFPDHDAPRIETEEPLDLPDGTQLLVLWSNELAADEKLDESPEAVEAWGKWHESLKAQQ